MRRLFLILAFCLLRAAVAGAQESAIEVGRILDLWTSFRWGQDCLIWVVHYPEALVEPWVRVEGARQGLSPHEMEGSAQSFRASLRMDETLPFLLSVYNFGNRPLSIGPIEKRLFLEAADGARLAPLSFEERLALPIEGLVQGLVFFPRREGAFSLVLTGLGPSAETRFSFAGGPSSGGGVEELLVDLPPLSQEPPVRPEAPSKPAVASLPQSPAPPVTEPPLAPEPEFAPPPPFLLLPSDPLPMRPLAEPPSEIEVPPVAPASEEPKVPPVPPASEEPKVPSVAPQSEDLDGVPPAEGLLPRGREATLDEFLSLWAAGETEKLYELLSEESRLLMTQEAFAKEARSRSFRISLRDGYRTSWLDDNRVKVTVAQKLVFIRVLQSETFRLVRQEGGWRVVW